MQNRPVVLVVDDESITVRLVSFALKALEIDVVGAEDARAALRVIEGDGAAIDLVLVDVNLPEVDGFVLVQHLREHPKTQRLPLLIFTARNHPPGRAARAGSGCERLPLQALQYTRTAFHRTALY
ncbi:MAG: response regulator [Blastochloris sp.]|nr:response regulator [Blastochloris sp.]